MGEKTTVEEYIAYLKELGLLDNKNNTYKVYTVCLGNQMISIPFLQKESPYTCPVCGGKGFVPNGFYTTELGCIGTISDATPEPCKSCNNTGILWK